MRTPTLLLASSLLLSFVAFVAPTANACAPIENCIGLCHNQCPPGCGDNIPCCSEGLVECLIGNLLCNYRWCYDPAPLCGGAVPCTLP